MALHRGRRLQLARRLNLSVGSKNVGKASTQATTAPSVWRFRGISAGQPSPDLTADLFLRNGPIELHPNQGRPIIAQVDVYRSDPGNAI